MNFLALLLIATPALFAQVDSNDIFAGLDRESKVLFKSWQDSHTSFNSRFFVVSSEATPPICSATFADALRDVRSAYDSYHRKDLEYFNRWLKETNETMKSRQHALASVEDQYARLQRSLSLKEQEKEALGRRQLEMDQLIKEDPEKGKAVEASWRRAAEKSAEGYQKIKDSIDSAKFNRNSTRINLEAILANLAETKDGLLVYIDTLEAEREFYVSYYDLRESEAELRCNRNLRPRQPLVGGPGR
jgi:hypothetical protein